MSSLHNFLVVLFVVISIYILIPWLIKIFLRKIFLKKVKNSGCVCLTFDDGPDPTSTPKILNLLKQANVKATFFVLGKNAEKYPEIVTEIIHNGHQVEEHSYEHSHAFKTGPIRTAKDLTRGARIVENLLSAENKRLIRPPYGKLNLISLLFIWLHKRGVVFWNIDPRDYASISGDVVCDFVISNLKPGCVILLHDARMATGESADVTVHAVKDILKEAAKKKLKFATVNQALSMAKMY